jgi:hypothetical protein
LLLLLLLLMVAQAHRLMEEDPRRYDTNFLTVVSGLGTIHFQRRETFLCLQIHQAWPECLCCHSLHWGSTERFPWCCIALFPLFKWIGPLSVLHDRYPRVSGVWCWGGKREVRQVLSCSDH